ELFAPPRKSLLAGTRGTRKRIDSGRYFCHLSEPIPTPFAPMRAKDCPELWFFLLVIYSVVVRLGTFNCSARVLDDFNDNLKTAWQDFSFPVGRYANIAEQNGQFKFALARRSADLQCQH